MTTEDGTGDLGKMLRQRRVALGLTRPQLARASGVSASYLAHLERGVRFPSGHILQKLAPPLGFEWGETITFAGYGSPEASPKVETPTAGRLDPYVARVLAQEPVEIQRTILAILSIFKYVTEGSQERIEFREYARRQYPELDEDVIIMIEDIIKRPQG